MRSSSAGLFPFFAISISGLSLPPSLSLINPDLSSSSNHLNQTFLGLTSVSGTTCTRAHGEEMNVASCNNAWQKIHRSSHSHRFIPRRDAHDASPNDMIVPIRYLSDDGKCAIDVLFKRTSVGDEATGDLISESAKTVLRQCVIMQGKGGVIRDFTRYDDLQIAIRKYEPVVHCEPRPSAAPSVESCDAVLTTVPAYKKVIPFGTTGAWHTIRGRLPKAFDVAPTTPASCYIEVTMPHNLPPTNAKWFDIWAAGVAVNTMCVHHGFTGTGVGLGDNGEISIALDVVGTRRT